MFATGSVLDQPYEQGRFEIHYKEPVLEVPSLDVQIGTRQSCGLCNGGPRRRNR